MGFAERRTGRHRPLEDSSPRPDDRYGIKPGPRSDASNEPFITRRPAARHAARAGRCDLAGLLGRSVLEAWVQQVCREYGLIPRTGAAVGSGLSRAYLARDAGVELAADAHGTVIAVFLHLQGDDGFASYTGEIPVVGGTFPRRASLWAALGRPCASADPYRDPFLGAYGPSDTWPFPQFVLDAQFDLDGDYLHRVTLSLPEELRAA
jgi:hypothetical protein